MPLQPVAHVPEALDGEVVGVCGGKLWPMLVDDAGPLQLWMALAADTMILELDAAGIEALQDLLADAKQRMRATG